MEEERAEGSCFLTVLCTEDQSSSQSSSTHVALALHGRSSQPFSQCTLFTRIISSFSCKCWHSPHLFPSGPFSELEFCLTPIWIRLRQMWLYYFCGCSVDCSSMVLPSFRSEVWCLLCKFLWLLFSFLDVRRQNLTRTVSWGAPDYGETFKAVLTRAQTDSTLNLTLVLFFM